MPFFFYFLEVENDFLHRINIHDLVKETGKTLDELAKLAGIKESRNLAKWSQSKEKGGSRPSFNAVVRLLSAGASTMTLFGVNTNELIEGRSKLTNEDLSRAFRIAADILEKNDK